jgi:hypothetical protein
MWLISCPFFPVGIKYPEIKLNLQNHICKIIELTKRLSINVDDNAEKPNSDDHLDAYIAWLLGKLWLTQSAADSVGSIKLIGDDDGYFLLPDVKIDSSCISELYDSFCKNKK